MSDRYPNNLSGRTPTPARSVSRCLGVTKPQPQVQGSRWEGMPVRTYCFAIRLDQALIYVYF
jgi:hypothetical protein